MKLIFLPSRTVTELTEGQTALEAAAAVGADIDGSCGGAGTCGKCRVRVISGQGNPPDAAELAGLSARELELGYRLACCFRPATDTVVELAATEEVTERKTRLADIFGGFPARQGGAAESGGAESGGAEPYYGVAFDIGTTTVVATLWDLRGGKAVATLAETNPQAVFGADVISRIAYAGASQGNLQELNAKIIHCCNGIIERFAQEYGVRREDIYEATVVGNTTMSHLFLGLDPASLARAPFTPAFSGAVRKPASQVGLHINKEGDFYLLPNIAGHVGSDITADILAVGVPESFQLLLDIGTNGEIVLSGGGRILACSTAAGPAFEGATIHQGMRAARGAIEGVEISEDVQLQVIGDAAPVGICGSGVIDAVACLLQRGLIESSGRFAKPEKLRAEGVPEALVSRLRRGENGMEFLLAGGGESPEVVIQQRDIREVQLAKAAMRAGIEIMMSRMGIAAEDLQRVCIAGAFGNYIKIESALAIGLLPAVPAERIVSVGNTAGAGAGMALLSEESKARAEELATQTEHVELAEDPDFQDIYVGAMGF